MKKLQDKIIGVIIKKLFPFIAIILKKAIEKIAIRLVDYFASKIEDIIMTKMTKYKENKEKAKKEKSDLEELKKNATSEELDEINQAIEEQDRIIKKSQEIEDLLTDCYGELREALTDEFSNIVQLYQNESQKDLENEMNKIMGKSEDRLMIDFVGNDDKSDKLDEENI